MALAAAPHTLPLPDMEEKQLEGMLRALLDLVDSELDPQGATQPPPPHQQQQQRQQQQTSKRIRCSVAHHVSVSTLPPVLVLHLQRTRWDAGCLLGPLKVCMCVSLCVSLMCCTRIYQSDTHICTNAS